MSLLRFLCCLLPGGCRFEPPPPRTESGSRRPAEPAEVEPNLPQDPRPKPASNVETEELAGPS
jgi:hypothetical protein